MPVIYQEALAWCHECSVFLPNLESICGCANFSSGLSQVTLTSTYSSRIFCHLFSPAFGRTIRQKKLLSVSYLISWRQYSGNVAVCLSACIYDVHNCMQCNRLQLSINRRAPLEPLPSSASLCPSTASAAAVCMHHRDWCHHSVNDGAWPGNESTASTYQWQ